MGVWRKRLKWREQALRFIDRSGVRRLSEIERVKVVGDESFSRFAVSFNVFDAREACLVELAAAKAREEERVVFTDWARSRGWAPGKPPAPEIAYDVLACPACRLREVYCLADIEYPDRPLRELRLDELVPNYREISGIVEVYYQHQQLHLGGDCPECRRGRGGWPGKLPKAWALRGHSRSACTPTPARTAQRILDTIDGRCPWSPGAPPLVGEFASLPPVQLRKRAT